MADFKELLGTVTVSSGRKSKTERSEEEIAQMPVYIRLTKAEVECLEDYVREEGLIPKDGILTPALLKAYFMAIFEKYGVDWSRVKKTLRNPTLIRK